MMRRTRSSSSSGSSNTTILYSLRIRTMSMNMLPSTLLLVLVVVVMLSTMTTGVAANNEHEDSMQQQEQEQQQQQHHRQLLRKPSGGNLSVLANIQQRLPTKYNDVVSDIKDGYVEGDEIPVLWKISKTGTSISAQPYMMDCLNLIVANEMGSQLSEGSSSVLEIVELPNERRYVNVDVSSKDGLDSELAKQLPSSGLANVIMSPLLNNVLNIFDTTHKAKLFTIIRHPVHRAVSHFYFQQHKEITSQQQNSQVPSIYKDMTLLDYASSNLVEGNYMVRTLVEKPTETLLPSDLYLAKTLLRQKFLIGLSDKMDESLERFAKYFKWDTIDHYRLGVFQRYDDCKAQYMSDEHISQQKIKHLPIEEGSLEWNTLMEKNWADIALYESAVDVYRQQSVLFQPGGIASGTTPSAPVPTQQAQLSV